MITTVTLNAALDKEYRLKTLQPGTVMRVAGCEATAGGKGLNVARVASALGHPVCASGFLGGHTGAQIEEKLCRTPIQPRFVSVAGESRTCINVIEDNGRSTEFLEAGFCVRQQDLDRFLSAYEALLRESDVVTLNGSLPKGCPVDFYAKLIGLARQREVPVLLDSSGDALLQGLKAQPTLVKPNRDELCSLLGAEDCQPEQGVKAAEELHRQGIPYVVLSMGKDGALMVCREGVFRGIAPAVTAVNTVGCGDSMMAAFALALCRGDAPQEMLRYALAVSAASAMHPATGGVDPEVAHALMQKAVVTKVANV